MSDLQLLSPVARQDPGPRHGRTAILVVALLLLAAAVCWVALTMMQNSRAEARTEAALGHSAHAAGDCAAAVPSLRSALSLGRIEFLEPPVDRDELRAEIAACEDLERARYAARHDKYERAVDGFDAYLGSGVARYQGAVAEQSAVRVAFGRELEKQDADGAVDLYAGVLADDPDGPAATKAEKRVWALFERDVTSAREDQPCTVLEPARSWTERTTSALAPVREAAHEALSWSLLHCAEVRIERGKKAARDANYQPKTFDRARSALTTAITEYPDTKPGRLAQEELEKFSFTLIQAQTKAAEVAKKRLQDKKIRAQVADALRQGGDLDRPRRTGSSGEKTRLTIRNATGGELYVAWSGKDPGSTTIPGGGKKCGKAPQTTITIPAGKIGLAVRSDGDWSAGTWRLGSNKLRTCVK